MRNFKTILLFIIYNLFSSTSAFRNDSSIEDETSDRWKIENRTFVIRDNATLYKKFNSWRFKLSNVTTISPTKEPTYATESPSQNYSNSAFYEESDGWETINGTSAHSQNVSINKNYSNRKVYDISDSWETIRETMGNSSYMNASRYTAESQGSSYSALQNFEGTISDDFLKLINPHWLHQDPQSHSTHYIFMFIFIIMAFAGLFGNGIVIFIYMKSTKVRTPANNFIFNLAIADFLIMLEAPLFIYNSLNFGPATGKLGCTIYALLGALGGTSAIMTLMAVSIDRYNVIVYPLNPSRSTTKKKSLVMILLVWIYSLIISMIPVFEIWGVPPYSPEGFLTMCSFDYLNYEDANYWYILIYAITAYFLPLIVIAFCYIRILRVVLSSKKIQSTKEKNKTEVRLAFVVMGIIGLWVFAWTPYCIIALIGIFGHGKNISPFASALPSLFAKIATCIDPYLYAVTHPRFRAEIEAMFCSGRKDNNFQTSFASKRQDQTESEMETVTLANKKKPLKRAESSFCEETTISENQ